MSTTWGNKFKISLYGESHSEAIGGIIDGMPPGIKFDPERIRFEMKRRAPGQSILSTQRAESDEVEIKSGIFNGYTTGTPIGFLIKNTNQRSDDYSEIKDLVRPSHADYTGYVKYKGFGDYRGGGYFSGRLTAALVFAGAVAMQALEEKGIKTVARIKSIHNISDTADFDFEKINRGDTVPAVDKNAAKLMEDIIDKARREGDSVGGVIECAVLNVPAGLGEPFFGSVESTLSSLLFSVPGVKGVEFGAGFEMTKMLGSEANDLFYMDGNQVKTRTNNNGGINGGITNGMPIVFRTAIRPTASIFKPQKTINLKTRSEKELTICGRHDPCIVIRAVPVIESCAAISVLDMLLFGGLWYER